MGAPRCICGEVKDDHHKPDGDGVVCEPGSGSWPVEVQTKRHCPCEGYQAPVRAGHRPVFGVDRQPMAAAETAEAWRKPEGPV